MASLNDQYNESKKYSNTIMSSIKSILEKKNISYDEKSSGSELIISNSKNSKKDIEKLLNDELNISSSIISILIKVTEIGNAIYIRQNTK